MQLQLDVSKWGPSMNCFREAIDGLVRCQSEMMLLICNSLFTLGKLSARIDRM